MQNNLDPSLLGQAPLRYNPYVHQNPLSRGQKIAIGVLGGVAAVGTIAAIILIPGRASAAPGPGTVTPDAGKRPYTGPAKPPGSPPPYGDQCFPDDMGGSAMYDVDYWDKVGQIGQIPAARQGIFDAFSGLGYQVPSDRSTMNDPGPDAAMGGGDDVPNTEVRRFQKAYNGVSRQGTFGADMGGLWEDGLVGPCTLNGVKYVMDNLNGGDWQQISAAAVA